MSILQVTLQGPPKGKVRHRSMIPWPWVLSWLAGGKRGKKPIPRSYSDADYDKWEEAQADTLRVAWGDRPPLDEACQLLVVAFFPRPKARTLKTRPNPRYPHTATPDRDNLDKAIQDALQRGGVVKNDSLIFAGRSIKWVCSGEEEPRTEVVLRWGSGCTLLR